ncbi:hypothetical protein RUM43_009610 [Polyplax serrata]|uniref:Cilia- and flagella-associated protein 263 n=1 Tax=Polyplax serrata TaxID=468196 RepID=A0AAN8NWD4_POLSC
MGPKKVQKPQSRWHPLPEGASTMQVIAVPEIDEYSFHPDDMTKEELLSCCKVIEQSNNTLEIENMIIEKYLTRMDPTSLEKMNQILEAAAAAIQKAERTAHLGGGGSTFSIAKEGMGSRVTDDSMSSSQDGTSKSTPTRTNKIGFFGLSDKGPKVPASQKIELVNREIDEMKTVLDDFRKKAKNFNYTLRCRNEEMKERLQEIKEAQINFEQKLMIEGLDPITGKLPGEKFIRYQEVRLKAEEIEIDRIRIKTGSLKSHLKKVKQQLAQKEELGEILHAVDFEQLQIENRECQERLEEKVDHLVEVKTLNGKYGNLLNTNKKKLQEQVNRLAELQENAVVKEQMIKSLKGDEERVNSEVTAAENSVTKIMALMKSFTVPDVMQYINTKAQLNCLKKEIKVLTRRVELKDLELASHVHKIRILNESLKSENQLRSVASFKSTLHF